MGEEHRVVAIGGRARAALERSAGHAEALSAFPGSPYLRAAGELIWGSARLPARHPRAVHVERPVRATGAVRFGSLPPPDVGACALPAATPDSLANARRGCTRLVAASAAIGAPQGLGLLLVGEAPPFPLDAGMPHVRALVRAVRAGDADAAC